MSAVCCLIVCRVLIKRPFIACLGLLTLMACAHTPPKKDLATIHGTWEVTELMSLDIQTLTFPGHLKNTPYFKLAKTEFSGFDGCNTFSGQWELQEEKLKFDKGVQTSMACVTHGEENPIDYYFNEAVNRNLVFEYDGKGTYTIITDLPPELRDWNLTEDGVLELIKSGKTVLKAKLSSTN